MSRFAGVGRAQPRKPAGLEAGAFARIQHQLQKLVKCVIGLVPEPLENARAASRAGAKTQQFSLTKRRSAKFQAKESLVERCLCDGVSGQGVARDNDPLPRQA